MPAEIAASAPGGDKLHHLLAFAALVFPAAAIRIRWTLPAMAFAVCYGWVIELIQPNFGRAYDLADLRADALGAMIGGLFGAGLGFALRRIMAAMAENGAATCRRIWRGSRP
jgi:hypothetical protein